MIAKIVIDQSEFNRILSSHNRKVIALETRIKDLSQALSKCSISEAATAAESKTPASAEALQNGNAISQYGAGDPVLAGVPNQVTAKRQEENTGVYIPGALHDEDSSESSPEYLFPQEANLKPAAIPKKAHKQRPKLHPRGLQKAPKTFWYYLGEPCDGTC